jgi:hypothetical protein
LAKRCRDLSQESFDLTIAGALRALSDELDAKSRRLDRVTANRNAFPLRLRLTQLFDEARAFARRFRR